jgi:hypothetical protein
MNTYSSPFTECGYVDHQCFFALYEMLDANGRLINPQRLAYEAQLLKDRLHRAHRDGIRVYHVFGRSLTEFLLYDAYGIYPEGHPRVESVQIFRREFSACLELAEHLGIRIGFSVNQFTFARAVYDKLGSELKGEGPGGRAVCPGKEKVWALYRDMLDEFFTACPGIGFLQLTTNETQVNVVDCSCPACAHLDIGDRIILLTQQTHEVCRKHDVGLQLRSWGEMEDEGFFDRISDAIDPGIGISVKNTQGDFHLYLPMHRMIGYGDRSQIVEFDAWREFSGWNGFPCFMGYRYQERLKACLQRGVTRVTLRLTWLPNHRLLEDIPWGNDLNRRVFLALLEDPDLDVTAWLQNALMDFQTSPCPELVSMYRDSSTWWEQSYFPDGMHLHSHSTVRTPWESGTTALQELEHWTKPLWRSHRPTAEALLRISRANAERWKDIIRQISAMRGRVEEKVHEDLLVNAKGQACLLELLPRLILIRARLEEPEWKPPGEYGEELNTLRDLALRWQNLSPTHFEDMLGAFVLKAVHEARLWLDTRRPRTSTPPII